MSIKIYRFWQLKHVLIGVINNSTGANMAESENTNFGSTRIGNAVNQRIQDFVMGKANDIKDPHLRNIANSLLGGVFGNSPNLKDNAYADLINNKMMQARNEIDAALLVNTGDSGGGTSGNDSQQRLGAKFDWRARLRPKKGGESTFYQKFEDPELEYLLQPIEESGGLVWQYTPNIFLSGSVNYAEHLAQGMNYPINTFTNSQPPEIPVTADFTANDIYEARYLLAVITFVKVVSKAYYGDSAVAKGMYGTPPPVLVFEYLGDHGFNKVPCVVSNYTIQYPDDVDYVPVTVNNTVTYVPSRTNVMINLKPQYTPHKLRRYFDIESVASGELYKGGFI